MTQADDAPIYATCVALDGRAILIEGPSGSGKSDLALRLIDRGAVLVSDDYTIVMAIDGRLFAEPPPAIAGKIEVRGLGIVDMPYSTAIPVALVIALDQSSPRMPEPGMTRLVGGVALPLVEFDGHTPSAAIKAELALARWGLAI